MQDPQHDDDDDDESDESNESANEDPDCIIPDEGEELDNVIYIYEGYGALTLGSTFFIL